MLKPYYSSIEQKQADSKIEFERLFKLKDLIDRTFPQDVEGQISFDAIGKTMIRAFIYLPREHDEIVTKKCVGFLQRSFSKTEKFFRENEGSFSWKGESKRSDENGEFDEMIFIENAHNQNCRITKKMVTKEIFVSDCSQKDT